MYKVGDKVKVIKTDMNDLDGISGRTGTVARIEDDLILVRFPRWDSGHDGFDTNETGRHCWYVTEADLVPVPAKKRGRRA